MKLPERIQRSRKKGYKTPPNTCYCGRGSKWGNPFVVGEEVKINILLRTYIFKLDLKTCLVLYDKWLGAMIEMEIIDLPELLKYDYLSCWCPLADKEGNHVPCHVDIFCQIFPIHYALTFYCFLLFLFQLW